MSPKGNRLQFEIIMTFTFNILSTIVYISVIGVIFGSGCAKSQPTMTTTFFQVVNQKGQEVRVRVLADREELFTVELGTSIETPGGIIPPVDKYPSKELKIQMPENTRVIRVQELISGMEKEWPVAGKGDSGFLIILVDRDISLEFGYIPVR